MVCPFINQVDKGGRRFVSQYELTDLFEFDFYKTPAHSLGSYVYLLSSLGNNLAILWLLRLLFS